MGKIVRVSFLYMWRMGKTYSKLPLRMFGPFDFTEQDVPERSSLCLSVCVYISQKWLGECIWMWLKLSQK